MPILPLFRGRNGNSERFMALVKKLPNLYTWSLEINNLLMKMVL